MKKKYLLSQPTSLRAKLKCRPLPLEAKAHSRKQRHFRMVSQAKLIQENGTYAKRFDVFPMWGLPS